MQLAPGPLPQIDISGYPTVWETPDFTSMVTAALAETDAIATEMDALIDPTAIFDDVLTGDTIMTDLETVDQINGDNAHLANLSGIPVGDQYKADGDTALVAAVQLIPGEAWTPVPASTGYGTVPQPAPTARISGVALANLTGPNPNLFAVGDQWQLVIHLDTTTGNVNDYFNVHVFCVLTKNGITQPNLDLGNTDSTGVAFLKGQWQPGDAGGWTMYVHADPVTGGDVVSQLYQWTVTDAGRTPAGPAAPVVTVQLANLTSGDLNNNHVGDDWRLTVTGPANSAVYITATQSGAGQSETQIGTTDAAGNFTMEGAWGGGDAGAWTEYYAVGRYPWTGTLTFQVLPRALPTSGPGGALGT
jgi:hypothetical protein